MQEDARLTEKIYQDWYQAALNHPETFWGEQAKLLTWSQPWEKVLTGSFAQLNVQWFKNAKLNVAHNCIDRHLETRKQQVAIIWEGDQPNEQRTLTYEQLHAEVCRFANVLKKYGVKKGDRVCIYLPMIPEAAIAMLACARIGAIHSVVFGGFSAEALKTRILDADCKLVVTANEGLRGGKIIPLKENVDQALQKCQGVATVILVKRTDNAVNFVKQRDVWYHEAMAEVTADCLAEIMDANDPLFILYTSGSTGTPKGILHSTGGYLVHVATTFKYVFAYQEGEIFWCTADVGWVTGHSYGIYGPLANGATTLMFEGVPSFPTPARFWEVIDKYKVAIFYTAPTAIRALRREGDDWVKQTSRRSLRLLGTVGEPINPEAWRWYFDVVGDKRCEIVDTWWQTETGGIMISPIPNAMAQKPGSAAKPFFGIVPKIVNEDGNPLPPDKMGNLIITKPWPGMMLTIYNNRPRFNNYFEKYSGNYLTGDQASCDEDGYYWIAGRDDDVIKVSGHRIGTEEVESALVQHPSVSEAAVVSIPDPIKGQSIYAYVTLKADVKPSEALKKELLLTVRNEIGAIAVPEQIQWTEALPKTRSGKIMRRLLRKIANHDTQELGDLSTLADPSVVESLIDNKED